ncbi:MAG: hypothetical protein WED10_03470 [Brumimicrobium sp.]
MISIKKTDYLTLLLFVVFTFYSKNSNAQGVYPISPFAANYFDPHFGIQAETYFNLDDIYFSFGLGLEDTGYDYGASLNLGFRPYFRKVLIEESENLFYQYHEKLFFLSIDLDKRFYFLEYGGDNRLGIYLAGKFGYLFGNYRGISKSLTDKFQISPGAGFAWEFKNARLNLGYLNFQTSEDLSPHMIQIKLNLFFNKNDE